jgi:signal transduction histidine kinase
MTELLDLLLDRTPTIMAMTIRDRTVVRASQGARDVLHVEPGQPLDPVFDERSRRKLADALRDTPATCELQALVKNRLIPVRVAVLPIDGGEHLVLVGRVGVEYAEALTRQLLAANDHLANVTRELGRQTAELDAARRRFEGLAELREHFVSMLAHDVRGALQSVVLANDRLERDFQSGHPGQVMALIDRTRHNTRRILELVDKVLEAARTEAGQITIDAKPVALGGVVRDAVETYRSLAESREIELAVVEPSGADVVSGDRVRLGQVAGNLIENAIRHSPPGTTVTIETMPRPGAVRVAVRDQGPGIPLALRDRIFERFVQGPDTGGSLGLGLYVARKLVELHHGQIFVESIAPHGAALVIDLPRCEQAI